MDAMRCDAVGCDAMRCDAMDGWMDGFYIHLSSNSVISGTWESDKAYAMKPVYRILRKFVEII